MKQLRWQFVTLALIFLLTATAIPSQAQDDGPPLDDEFITALVMMSVNDNLMQG